MNINQEIKKIKWDCEEQYFFDDYRKCRYICLSIQKFYAQHYKKISLQDLHKRQQYLRCKLDGLGGVDGIVLGVIGGFISYIFIAILFDPSSSIYIFSKIEETGNSIFEVVKNYMAQDGIPFLYKLLKVILGMIVPLSIVGFLISLPFIYMRILSVLCFSNAHYKETIWKYEFDLIKELLEKYHEFDLKYTAMDLEEIDKKLAGCYTEKRGCFKILIQNLQKNISKKLNEMPQNTFVILFLIIATMAPIITVLFNIFFNLIR